MKHLILAASIVTALTPVALITATNPANAFLTIDEATLEMQIVQQAEQVLHTVELVRSNENWIIQLLPMSGSLAEGFVGAYHPVLENMRGTQKETAEILLDPSGAGQHDAYIAFRKMQLERDMAYLENVSLRMETVSQDSEISSQTVAGLVDTSKKAQGGLETSQLGNELSAVQARKQEQTLATLQDILRADVDERARQTEENLLSIERHCVMYPDEC